MRILLLRDPSTGEVTDTDGTVLKSVKTKKPQPDHLSAGLEVQPNVVKPEGQPGQLDYSRIDSYFV